VKKPGIGKIKKPTGRNSDFKDAYKRREKLIFYRDY